MSMSMYDLSLEQRYGILETWFVAVEGRFPARHEMEYLKLSSGFNEVQILNSLREFRLRRLAVYRNQELAAPNEDRQDASAGLLPIRRPVEFGLKPNAEARAQPEPETRIEHRGVTFIDIAQRSTFGILDGNEYHKLERKVLDETDDSQEDDSTSSTTGSIDTNVSVHGRLPSEEQQMEVANRLNVVRKAVESGSMWQGDLSHEPPPNLETPLPVTHGLRPMFPGFQNRSYGPQPTLGLQPSASCCNDNNTQDPNILLPFIRSSSLPAPSARFPFSNSSQATESPTTSPDSLPISTPTNDFTSTTGSAQELSDISPPSFPVQWLPSDLRFQPRQSAEAGPSRSNYFDSQPSQPLGTGMNTEIYMDMYTNMSNAQVLNDTGRSFTLDSGLPSFTSQRPLNPYSHSQVGLQPSQSYLEPYPVSGQQFFPPVPSSSCHPSLYEETYRYSEAIPNTSSNAWGTGTLDGYAGYFPSRKRDSDGNEKGKGKERMSDEIAGQDLYGAEDREEPLAPTPQGMMRDDATTLEDFGTGNSTTSESSLTSEEIMIADSLLNAMARRSGHFPLNNLKADDSGKGKGKNRVRNFDMEGDHYGVEDIEAFLARTQGKTNMRKEDGIVAVEDFGGRTSLTIPNNLVLEDTTSESSLCGIMGYSGYLPESNLKADGYGEGKAKEITGNLDIRDFYDAEGGEEPAARLYNETRVRREDNVVVAEEFEPIFSTKAGKFPRLRPIIDEASAAFPPSELKKESAEIDLYSIGATGERLARIRDNMAFMEKLEAETLSTAADTSHPAGIIAGPLAAYQENQLKIMESGMGQNALQNREEPPAKIQDGVATMKEGKPSLTAAITVETRNPGQSVVAAGPSAVPQSPDAAQISDLCSQLSEMSPQKSSPVSEQSSNLDSVYAVDDVSDQMTLTNGSGGFDDAVGVAVKTGFVGAWCGVLNGEDEKSDDE